MADCAVMGADWRRQTWWEYQALLSGWNARHTLSGDKTPPSPASAARIRQVLDAHSIQ